MPIDCQQRQWQPLATPPSTPGSIVTSRPRTATQILAAFSPRPQFKRSLPQVYPSPQSYPIVMMADRRSHRKRQPVVYEISDDEEHSSQLDSSYSSPEKATRKRRSIIHLDDESEEIEPPVTPPPRSSTAGHSLRQHGDLKLSLQARENGDKRVRKKRKTNKRKSKDILKPSVPVTSAPTRTARNEIRDHISKETAGKRAKFFVAHKDTFLPLLPEENYVRKLVAQHGSNKMDESVKYKAIEKQPCGWVQ